MDPNNPTAPSPFNGAVDQNPFSGVDIQNPPKPPEVAQRQGQIAAIANVDVGQPYPQLLSQFDQLTQSYTKIIQDQGDANIRTAVANQQKIDAVNTLASFAGQVNPHDQEMYHGAQIALRHALEVDAQQNAEYALEAKAVKNIEDLAASGNGNQAAILQQNYQLHGQAIDSQERMIKQMILQREIENAEGNVQNQGWMMNLGDFVLRAIPFRPNLINEHLIPGEVDRWYNWLWSGQGTRDQAASLFSMPLDQYTPFVRNTLIPTLQHRSQLWGYPNNGQTLETLTNIMNTPPAWQKNTFDTLDNLGWVPFTKAYKGLQLTGLLLRRGALDEAVAATTRHFAETMGNGAAVEEAGGLAGGVTREEAVKNILPSYVNPDATVYSSRRAELMSETALRAVDSEGQILRSVNAEGIIPAEGDWLSHEHFQGHPVNGDGIEVVPTHGDVLPGLPQPEVKAVEEAASTDAKVVETLQNGGSEGTPPVAPTTANPNVMSNSVTQRVEQVRRLIQGLPQISLTDRFLSEEEKALAIRNWEESLVNEAEGRSPLTDVNTHRVDLPSGQHFYQTEAVVHPPEGVWVSKDEAINGMKSLGYPGEVFQNESGRWYGRLRLNMNETGIYSQTLNPAAKNILARLVSSARALSDEALHGLGLRAGTREARLMRSLRDKYQKIFATLSPRSRQFIAVLLQHGQNNKVWLTDRGVKEFFQRAYKRLPTDAEMEAYHAAIELNDIGYVARNEEMFSTNAAKGYETVSFSTGLGDASRENAIIHRDSPTLEQLNAEPVFDLRTGKRYAGNLTQEEFDQLVNEGRMRVVLQQPMEMSNGRAVRTFIGHPTDFEVEPLRYDQLPYQAGLNRIYAPGQYFIKQARAVLAEGGITRLLNPHTFYAGTKAEMDFVASKLEQARQAAVRGADASMIDRIFAGHQGLHGQDFLDALESGMFNKDHPFEVTGDRQMPTAYTSNKYNLDWIDPEHSGVESYTSTRNNRLYYGKRGDRILDWTGNLAPVLDPYQTIDRALRNVAGVSSYSDYKRSAIEHWVKSFKDDFINISALPRGASDYVIFRDGVVKSSVPEHIRQAIEAQRDVIKRTLNWRSQIDVSIEALNSDFRNALAGADPASLRHKAAHAVLDWTSDFNPVTRAKSFASDLKLGLFNVAQFPLQMSTAVAATTLSPKYGMAGWAVTTPMKMLAMTFKGSKDLDWFASKFTKLGGFASENEAKAWAQNLMESGWLNPERSHAWMGDVGSSLGNNYTVSKALENSRVFFNLPETVNRIVANRIAWGEAVEKFGPESINTIDFKNYVALRTDDYSLNMTKQSAAWWQRNPLTALPTQFWAYNARMMQAMFGKQFTLKQRASLMAWQTFLYGSAGVPGASLISQWYKSNTGQEPGLDTWQGFADRGFLDEVFYHMTGADVSASQRYGTGTWIPDTIAEIFNSSQYGEKSMADVLGGASFSVLYDTSKTMYDVVRYSVAESGDQSQVLTRDALLGLAQEISSVGNVTKAMFIHQYGVLLSRSGTEMVAGLPSQDAWVMAVFGLQPGQVLDLNARSGFTKDRKAQIDDVSKVLVNLRTKMAREPDKREETIRAANALARITRPDIYAAALRQANQATPRSVYENLGQSVEKAQRQQQLFQNAAEQNGPTN